MPSKDGRYRIIDEPRPGPLSAYAMNPMWPFLALMMLPALGGVLFLVNALALRARTFWAELALLAASLAARLLGPRGLAELYDWALWPAGSYRYALAIPIGIALYLGYRLFMLQATAHELKTYYDRPRES